MSRFQLEVSLSNNIIELPAKNQDNNKNDFIIPVTLISNKRLLVARMKRIATSAMEKAYSPYSGVKVGAALLDDRGKIFSGCNVENASYSLTICAERVAAVKAISSGSKYFLSILIVSNLEGYTYPCGACRQFLMEFSAKDRSTNIIVVSNKGRINVVELEKLLPNTFKLGSINR